MYGAQRARDRNWQCLDDSGRFSGSWIELRYAASYFCVPVRPLLRFVLKGGATETVSLPAPVCGSAIWRGQVPAGAIMWIDPGPGVAPDRFRVDDVLEIPFSSIAARAIRTPRAGLIGLMQHASGRRDGGRRKLAAALYEEPLEAYVRWRAERRRDPDPDGLDRLPPGMGDAGPLLLNGQNGTLEAWQTTIESLSSQFCPEWRLRLTADMADADTWRHAAAICDEPRIEVVARGGSAMTNSDILAHMDIEPGDRLPFEAVGVIRWLFSAMTSVDRMDFDEDEPAETGGAAPVLRLPAPEGRAPRTEVFRVHEPDGSPSLPACQEFAFHMPRVLLHKAGRQTAPARAVSPAARLGHAKPSVDIVIPTRDQAELLQRCLDSVLNRTDFPDLKVLIADNDSREQATLDLFAKASTDPRVSVHPAPGKFNFAAICNATASKGAGDVIVFLNNDVEAAEPGWLSAMVDLALRPSIGAVGAKLVYPSGEIQHAGMVLGLHGSAGHLYRGALPGDPGYRERLVSPHLVSAVTGACLAIERSKFERIGGFDAATFPVEYNDIDLCLRLMEAGLPSAWTPDAVLIHAESATRGRPFLPGYRRKGTERAEFLKRWGDAVANDPCFHPAFSLSSETLRLA